MSLDLGTHGTSGGSTVKLKREWEVYALLVYLTPSTVALVLVLLAQVRMLVQVLVRVLVIVRAASASARGAGASSSSSSIGNSSRRSCGCAANR